MRLKISLQRIKEYRIIVLAPNDMTELLKHQQLPTERLVVYMRTRKPIFKDSVSRVFCYVSIKVILNYTDSLMPF